MILDTEYNRGRFATLRRRELEILNARRDHARAIKDDEALENVLEAKFRLSFIRDTFRSDGSHSRLRGGEYGVEDEPALDVIRLKIMTEIERLLRLYAGDRRFEPLLGLCLELTTSSKRILSEQMAR